VRGVRWLACLAVVASPVLAALAAPEATAPSIGAHRAECAVPLTLPAPPDDRPSYKLRVKVAPGLRDASGTLDVTFRPAVSTSQLVFRLLPNSPAYVKRGSRLTVGAVSEGSRVLPTRKPNPTTLIVTRPRAAGERATVSMSWKLHLPSGSGLVLKGGTSVRLASFFPLLAWDGRGWARDSALQKLDSFWSTSPTADFDVRIDTPRGLRVLAAGLEVARGHWRAQAVRDFAVAVGKFTIRQSTVRLPQPVRVSVALERGSSYPINVFLSASVRSLRWYAQRYAPYPWPSYTLAVMTDFAGFAGTAYPTITFLGDGSAVLIPHETAHQWFYSLAGNNQSRDPWLSEGTASWAQTGPQGSLGSMVGTAIPSSVRNKIGEPMSFWDSRGFEQFRLGVYVQTVQALNELGDAADVDCALRQFVVANAFRTATPADLLAALEDFFPDAEQTLSARGAHF
jgi:hypothetical protein